MAGAAPGTPVLCCGVDGGMGFCSAPPAHQAALSALVKLTALVNLWVVLIGRAKWVQFPKTLGFGEGSFSEYRRK